ncbi:hypothetical protein VNO77_31050 [Canavalia gladiata]|uniref:RING-type domain-containing protein n=1 Tax=Canavalia gladiata TaxID=3824 RepID=A0AAN9Q1M4_CANGL
MESSYHLYVNPFDEPTISIPQESPFSDYFYINFNYTLHEIIPSQTHPSNFTYDDITTIDRIFLVPREILCDCNEVTVLDRNNTIFMHDTFSSVPISPELLDAILPLIGECAREMIAQNREGRNIWEMDVRLLITVRPSENDNDQDQCASLASQIVDSMEKVRETDFSIYSAERCAICLEEFCNGSKLELVLTRCFHVFHKECLVQWLHNCLCRQSSHTCPLCRCQIC